jgi:hypothetical protein
VSVVLRVECMVMIVVGTLEVSDPIVEFFNGFHLKLPASWRAQVTGGCVSDSLQRVSLCKTSSRG